MEALALKTLFDTLPGGFLITDPTARVVYANHAVEKRTGYAVAEMIGKKPGELWGGHMPRSFYRLMWEVIARKKSPFVGAVENITKQGMALPDTLHIAPVTDEAGTPRYFIEVHPWNVDTEERRDFSQRFLARGALQYHSETTWQWMFQTLGGEQSASMVSPDEPSLRLLVDIFTEVLVIPTQEQFLRRIEDAPLILAAQRDPRAFGVLYQKYIPLIRQYFTRRITDPREAEDLAQDVFARAFHYLPSFRVTNASYYTYLIHIAHSRLVNYYRRQAPMPLSWVEEIMEGEEGAIPQLDTHTFEELLQELGLQERTALRLKYLEDCRVREIAAVMGKSENAVKLLLSRGRKKLRMLFQER